MARHARPPPHGGLFTFLTAIIQTPLPNSDHPGYRIITRCKVDAATCFMRCFEQMRAQDLRFLTPDIRQAIIDLTKDDDLIPLSLRRQAQDALNTLNQ